MNTRKYPRTLNEAFGPYASGPISEPTDYSGLWWSCIAAIAFIGLVVVVVTR